MTQVILVCLACTFAEYSRLGQLETALNETLQTQCFGEKMSAQGVPYSWIEKLQNASRDIPLHYYFADNRTVGYMNPGQDDVYLNRKFHDSFSTCKQASNIAHELSHILGYRHLADVAYATNYSFEACCF